MINPLIIALDYPSKSLAMDFLQKVDAHSCAIKIGSELFTATGADYVRSLVSQGYRVFLDLKFHDIPNTVAAACQSAAELGVWMINVHASGGSKMMREARNSLESYGDNKPLLIGVTILTSVGETDFKEIACRRSIKNQTEHLAQLSYQCGLDGVVCSAQDVETIKAHTNLNFLTVTPGIRLKSVKMDDQTRTTTPVEAIQNGADYLVVGRPITQAVNPNAVIQTIMEEIKGASLRK